MSNFAFEVTDYPQVSPPDQEMECSLSIRLVKQLLGRFDGPVSIRNANGCCANCAFYYVGTCTHAPSDLAHLIIRVVRGTKVHLVRHGEVVST